METATATIDITGPRNPGARPLPLAVIEDGPYAGARFYLGPSSPAWDLYDGATVRVRFHPEDQFCRRVMEAE